MRVTTCTRCAEVVEVRHDHAHRPICEACAFLEGCWVVPLEDEDEDWREWAS